LDAQLELGAAAIGGKDSMSGSFLEYDVPPTLISFAIAPIDQNEVLTPEFKEAGNPVYLFGAADDTAESLKATWEAFHGLQKAGKVKAGWAVEYGIAEAVMKMGFGNNIGFKACDGVGDNWDQGFWGFLVAELTEDVEIPGVIRLGQTTNSVMIRLDGEQMLIQDLQKINQATLESVYPTKAPVCGRLPKLPVVNKAVAKPAIAVSRPKVLIPVFPGTNCEFDSAKAFADAGIEPEIFVINNLSGASIAESVNVFAKKVGQSQIIFVPGGFSGGDEPDGSGKFITAFFRAGAVKDAVTDLLECRDGLMAGICNGFQALIKLGLVPYGKIIDTDESCPTLTFNTIGRHQSRIVRTRIASNKSPWLSEREVGDIISVPISHGEGRFFASEGCIKTLADNGQIATQYVDLAGNPTADIHFNPNNSACAIEGITSPDGRVFGKMGHSERIGEGLYKNVEGNFDLGMFRAAAKYFKI
ncbi:MAG: phosphoribosylformylglycinamidine synthase subunit PurQ, partial [Clostridia bacterium]|nr:phosphoribosylformylglycinamidine synthase subunit PurQ [Clostridia bacterium]